LKHLIIALFTCVIFSPFCSAQSDYLAVLEDKSLRIDTSYWVNLTNVVTYDTLDAWKKWRTVENFTFEKDRGDLSMIADLNALHPYFRDKMQQLINVCAKKKITLVVVESFRTRAKQAEYFGMGKKYTRSVGGKSKHQYGLACDVVPLVNGVALWDDKALWRKIGIEGEKLGLHWGGRWRTPFDPAHFEWTGGFTTIDLVLGNLPKPNDNGYPCLDEDIKTLRRFWEACENEQHMISRNRKMQSIVSSQRP